MHRHFAGCYTECERPTDVAMSDIIEGLVFIGAITLLAALAQLAG